MSLSKHANPDNLEKGTPVTVIQGPTKQVQSGGMNPFGMDLGTTETKEDTSYHGDILVVKAVSYPFVVFRYVKENKDVTLDLREGWKLAIPDEEFVREKFKKLKRGNNEQDVTNAKISGGTIILGGGGGKL